MQKDFRAEDKAMRAKLESQSSGGTRANVTGMVNQMAKVHAEREMPGLSAYGVIRLLQGGGAAKRLERAGIGERFVTPIIEGQTYNRVKDVGDSGNNGPRPIEPEFLTVQQMRVIAVVKALQSRYY